jgi:hypothetical protein
MQGRVYTGAALFADIGCGSAVRVGRAQPAAARQGSLLLVLAGNISYLL